jgi:hypothetical protein
MIGKLRASHFDLPSPDDRPAPRPDGRARLG